MTALEIKLDKFDRVYSPTEVVTGCVIVKTPNGTNHTGIKMTVEGAVTLQLSPRSVGIFEALYNSIKPLILIRNEFDIKKSGKFKAGTHEIPFEFPLKALPGLKLAETYHGVYISVQYLITVEMTRSMLAKNIKRSCEFIVKKFKKKKAETERVDFILNQDIVRNKVKNKPNVPQFLIEGYFDHGVCNVDEPFTGEFVLQETDRPIKSIELQLVRVETCSYAENEIKEATEVQNIQLVDGTPTPGVPIPIYMIFPRLFTCSTTSTKEFKVSFEVNIVVLFEDSHMVTENFTIKLTRYRNSIYF